MSEEKFTPGPWKAGKNKHFLSVLDGNEGKAIYAGDDIVAWANGIDRDGQPDIDTALKNANLIAKAPEMLEMLNEVGCDIILGLKKDVSNINLKETIDILLEDAEKIDKLLKQARGEE